MAEGRILIVGAGFAGAVHARTLAEAGYRVEVIDRRPHIAGNAYDEIDANGNRVHRYGPHLFHTNNETVVAWLKRFGAFTDYAHKVEALIDDGRFVPLPVNRRTIEAVFDTKLADASAAERFLKEQAVPIEAPANAAEHLNSQIGQRLTDLFFRPYTKKMWAMDLEDMSAAVVQRIPIRTDDEDHYFPNDKFQMLPDEGYTAIFESILDHDNISVRLSTEFDKAMLADYDHCFNSMPIDEYYDEAFGPLPYRSIRFHHDTRPANAEFGTAATINFTDSGPITRETDWGRLPGHRVADAGPNKTVTREEPCDYRDNDLERYYPVKTSDGRYDKVYQQYKTLADREGGITFIGRCGTYQYLDMHQVINQSLASAERFLRAAR